jgi:hypothetical protein
MQDFVFIVLMAKCTSTERHWKRFREDVFPPCTRYEHAEVMDQMFSASIYLPSFFFFSLGSRVNPRSWARLSFVM